MPLAHPEVNTHGRSSAPMTASVPRCGPPRVRRTVGPDGSLLVLRRRATRVCAAGKTVGETGGSPRADVSRTDPVTRTAVRGGRRAAPDAPRARAAQVAPSEDLL